MSEIGVGCREVLAGCQCTSSAEPWSSRAVGISHEHCCWTTADSASSDAVADTHAPRHSSVDHWSTQLHHTSRLRISFIVSRGHTVTAVCLSVCLFVCLFVWLGTLLFLSCPTVKGQGHRITKYKNTLYAMKWMHLVIFMLILLHCCQYWHSTLSVNSAYSPLWDGKWVPAIMRWCSVAESKGRMAHSIGG